MHGNRRHGKADAGKAPRGAHWPVPTLALALVLGLLAACASGRATSADDLPEFPEYEEAQAFLEFQRRTQRAVRPPTPHGYPYTERNQHIYEQLERQRRLSKGELAARARLREENLQRRRAANLAEFRAMRERLARDELADALREQERAQAGQRFRAANLERFSRYQQRLDRLAREQEALAQEREVNRFRNQQRVEARFAEQQRQQRAAEQTVQQRRQEAQDRRLEQSATLLETQRQADVEAAGDAPSTRPAIGEIRPQERGDGPGAVP